MYNDYTTYTTGYNGTESGLLVGIGAGLWILSAAVTIFMVICLWKIYKKAGKPGWASIVPIYNIIVLLEIVELPMWYIALLILPFANIYAMFKIYIELAHKFGKSTGFGVLMAFFNVICLPILAFGKNEYKGNNNNGEVSEVTPDSTPLPQTFSSEQNNTNNIDNFNNINNQANENNPMTETGFVPVGNLDNNIEKENNNQLDMQEQNKEIISTPVSPIPNVEPVVPTAPVNEPAQTITNTPPEEQTINNNIVNDQQQSMGQNNSNQTLNSNQNNGPTIFTNMNNQ